MERSAPEVVDTATGSDVDLPEDIAEFDVDDTAIEAGLLLHVDDELTSLEAEVVAVLLDDGARDTKEVAAELLWRED